MKRRKFLQNGWTASAALMLPANDLFAITDSPKMPAAAGFELIILATNWGFKGDMNQFCEAAKKEGYDGIEIWWNPDIEVQKTLTASLKKHDLEIGFLCGSGNNDAKANLTDFQKNLDGATAFTSPKPLYINCHSGKDFFTYEQNKLFIDYTTLRSQSSGIPIYHETHRGRMLFAAPISRNFIERNPTLRLTLDVSHWCNVHESLLENQAETMDIVLPKVEHVHARVGHAEGPQVSDPRAPEWATALYAHLAWWDKIVARKKQMGEKLTILTEFGPPNYLPTLPFSNMPVANQWDINVYMMNLLRKRYS